MPPVATRRAATCLAVTAAVALAAGCGGGPQRPSAARRTAGPTATPANPTPSAPPASVAGASPARASDAFEPIVEPFDPDHPATARPGGTDCASQTSTADIEQCDLAATENVDARIDTVRQAAYAAATAAARQHINDDDAVWLHERGPICQAAYHSGGSIDEIDIAACLLDESTARLNGLSGVTGHLAHLAGTDNPDPGSWQFSTTADGTRITAVHSQGDQTGGAVIDWVVIGGYRGSHLSAADFRFVDGTFTDDGVVEPGQPTSVGPAQRADFSVDYSHLAEDPNSSRRTGRFVYSPAGQPVVAFS